MTRKHFRLGLDGLSKVLLQHLRDPSVELPPRALEQAGVGRVPNQRVLEDVGGMRGHASLEDQLRPRQPAQRVGELFFPGDDRRQQIVGKLPADDRGNLGYVFDRSEAVETRHQRVLQRRRDRRWRQRALELIAVVLLPKHFQFEHRLGQLLKEQRHAFGLGHDLVQDHRR